ncbi:MAG: 50S ribosomal protein L11 methyltransferase [Ferruginibacter sp.]|nr:50S ribosomal protein L11 methyltransferase [Ferruginibacter sp.]
MDYIQLLFRDISEDEKDVLIALLGNIGFEGFEEETDTLKALIPQSDYDENLFNSVIYLNNLKYSKSIIKEKNWNEKCESDFEAVSVNDPTTSKPFVYIRAAFHKPANSFKYNIEVTPKMSFGTGHHATTYLMVANMSYIDFNDKSVIDFGTGTGVLGILAEKLGAKTVLAIDNDGWSIKNAEENVAVNNCNLITIECAETIPQGNKADIILANINLNIIKANITAIKNASSERTVFLLAALCYTMKKLLFPF